MIACSPHCHILLMRVMTLWNEQYQYDCNVSSGLKRPIVYHQHPHSGLKFFFVFVETQLTLLIKQNQIHLL